MWESDWAFRHDAEKCVSAFDEKGNLQRFKTASLTGKALPHQRESISQACDHVFPSDQFQ